MALDALVVVLVALIASLWWLWCLRSGSKVVVLPPELRTAQLIYAERLFRSVWPVSITAKVDRVYRNGAGELVLMELKTRRVSRTYLSDVIELSAQRIAIIAQTGNPVAGHAYVLIEEPESGEMSSHYVKLMQHNDLTALALRREALRVGEADPLHARSPGICRACGFLQECRSSNFIPLAKDLKNV